MKIRIISLFVVCFAVGALQGCKHPLAIVGEGDIVEENGTGRGCTLEQFQAESAACKVNEVTGDYHVNFKAEPRDGWRFVRWEGPCSPQSDFQHCRFDISKSGVAQWDENYPDTEIPPSTAVFQPIEGETGYLLAGTPVAGVTYETPTQQGVTGLDGSFQYEEGETVRFSIGATVLGEITGKEEVTPFDLAGSPIQTGIHITWALQDQNDPYQKVINLTVLLHSLDDDGNPDNGIVITAGVDSLLYGIALNLHRPWDMGEAEHPDTERPWLTFQTDPTFHHVLGLARRQHRFRISHAMADPAVALASLYGGLNIDPKVVGLSRLGDPSSTGHFDTLDYDANGNLIRHERKVFVTAYETWEYDQFGKVVRHEDHGLDQPNNIETWQYDAMGNLTRFEKSDHIDITTYLYDDDYNPTNRTWTVQKKNNVNPLDFFYEYDALGRLKQFTSREGAGGFNRWRFNAKGKVVYHEEHFGYTDEYNAETWFYNSAGNVTRHESNSAGAPDIFEYNADGKLIRWEQQTAWNDRGLYRLAVVLEYDDNGLVIRRETVNLEDDESPLEVETWQYNEEGRVISRKSGETETETWQYYDSGVVQRHTSRYGDTSFVDQFDPLGNLIREESIPDNDESSTETWSYDPEGKLVFSGPDRGSDSTREDGISYQYTATGWHHLFAGIKGDNLPYRPPSKPVPAHEERPPNNVCVYQFFLVEIDNC